MKEKHPIQYDRTRENQIGITVINRCRLVYGVSLSAVVVYEVGE